MARIPDRTIEDAPEVVRPMLEAVARASLGTGGLLSTGDKKLDVPLAVVREATLKAGHVDDATWHLALETGWTDAQPAEAFAHIGVIVFVSYFVNYAETAKTSAMRFLRADEL